MSTNPSRSSPVLQYIEHRVVDCEEEVLLWLHRGGTRIELRPDFAQAAQIARFMSTALTRREQAPLELSLPDSTLDLTSTDDTVTITASSGDHELSATLDVDAHRYQLLALVVSIATVSAAGAEALKKLDGHPLLQDGDDD